MPTRGFLGKSSWSTDRRIEWKKSTHHMLGMGVNVTAHHILPRKHLNESHYTGAEQVSEPHDLLVCHPKADGKGVHTLVGDISKVEG